MRPATPACLLLLIGTFACGDDDVPHDGGTGQDAAVADAAMDTRATDAGTDAPDASPCEAPTPGTFHDQELTVDGETRAYFLYVPTSASCNGPLLIDFHGTATGERPEESYGMAAMTEMAVRHGVIVARPRSGSYSVPGAEVFQWDAQPGDVQRNRRFAAALVDHLAETYAVDGARVYASGFSSGSNMAAQVMGDEHFHGFGMVAGGAWTPRDDPDFGEADEPPRIYFDTGYRDYLWRNARDTLETLDRIGHPTTHQLMVRSDGAHELYDRTWETMWRFLDEGTRPPSREGEGDVLVPAIALELIDANPDSSTPGRALGAAGEVWARAEDTWEEGVVTADRPPALTGGCATAAGTLLIGEGRVFWQNAGNDDWLERPAAPEILPGGMFGSSWLLDVACTESGAIFGVGYWTGIVSRDGGESWTGADITSRFGALAQAATVEAMGETVVAAGYYDYIGVRRAGDDGFTPVVHTTLRAHWYDVAATLTRDGSAWYVVGDDGTVLRSEDNAGSFQNVSPTLSPADDAVAFYAVAAVADRVVVGGDGGLLWLSEDRGESWRTIDTGDGFIGGLHIDEDHILVAGAQGVLSIAY